MARQSAFSSFPFSRLRSQRKPPVGKRLRHGSGPTLPKINTATDSCDACRGAPAYDTQSCAIWRDQMNEMGGRAKEDAPEDRCALRRQVPLRMIGEFSTTWFRRIFGGRPFLRIASGSVVSQRFHEGTR